jgi:competence protein ComEC
LVVATPPTFYLVLFHLLLGITLWVFWPVEMPEKPSADWEGVARKRKRFVIALKGIWVLFVLAVWIAWVVSERQVKPFRMTFLSVGHGNAVVVEDPHGHVMVVDGGPRRDGPARWNPVVAYLRHQGVRKVDWVVSSHPDSDHVGGLAAVVESFPTAAAAQPLGAQSRSFSYLAFLKALEKRGTPLKGLTRGEMISLGAGETLEVVHPPRLFQPRKKKDNNRSLALWITVPPGKIGKTFLLPGDMEKEAWDVLWDGAQRLEKVDVLLTSHHGRPSGQPERVMGALKPVEVVVSDSGPHPEIKPLPQAEIRETDLEGAIWVEVDAVGRMKVDSWRPLGNKKQGENRILEWENENLEKE